MKAIIYTDTKTNEINMDKEKIKIIFKRMGTHFEEKDLNDYRIHLLKHDQLLIDPTIQLDRTWLQGFNEKKLINAISINKEEKDGSSNR